MDSELFVKLATILITLLGAIVTYVLIPYIKSKTTKEQREDIEFWVTCAVAAAEQIFKLIPKSGAEKKQYVIDFLNSQGIKLTAEELDVLIEAAVKELSLAEDAFKEEESPPVQS